MLYATFFCIMNYIDNINREKLGALKAKGLMVLPVRVSSIKYPGKKSKSKEIYGLVDTGSSISVVDIRIIRALGSSIFIGEARNLKTPLIEGKANTCPLTVTFLEQSKSLTTLTHIFEKPLKTDFKMIIGTDILKYFRFYWNGPEKNIEITEILEITY